MTIAKQAMRLVTRSTETQKDSKGYKAVCEADPYNVPIKKSECIGHMQKRVGPRNLRDGVFNNLYDDVVDETAASNDSIKKMKTKKPAKLRLIDKMINNPKTIN